ncbi:MAG: T9SS type A sorting domain-containing protein [candidate division Zixibacteria bacterium]|nr:T9SS type A sorting domain-containing protein [candidate division Zixibacteria bacterium]NIS49496.1 T9SS type A sorting domain-containing protein [candidate division Zixibacteria bacterium]NIU17575.1 T9SS type A sorting domain-containing protein [candidate division Zixibacteria bacterium]NIV09726.1 T9SS type A sorting domain-containing protein [candidate division Zixibacteria bacterium]NIX59959.1 T9SS type A sorting domain-containing protein [candidate division Zixibacteria bacterium]
MDDIVLDFPVGLPDQANLSQQYAVSPNYPNPFNPTTTIRYQLPERHQVTLMIYNLLGQRVRTLLNQTMAAGTHQVIWKGRNDQGEPVSSGIYVYRFRAGDFQKSQKMILLK